MLQIESHHIYDFLYFSICTPQYSSRVDPHEWDQVEKWDLNLVLTLCIVALSTQKKTKEYRVRFRTQMPHILSRFSGLTQTSHAAGQS